MKMNTSRWSHQSLLPLRPYLGGRFLRIQRKTRQLLKEPLPSRRRFLAHPLWFRSGAKETQPLNLHPLHLDMDHSPRRASLLGSPPRRCPLPIHRNRTVTHLFCTAKCANDGLGYGLLVLRRWKKRTGHKGSSTCSRNIGHIARTSYDLRSSLVSLCRLVTVRS